MTLRTSRTPFVLSLPKDKAALDNRAYFDKLSMNGFFFGLSEVTRFT